MGFDTRRKNWHSILLALSVLVAFAFAIEFNASAADKSIEDQAGDPTVKQINLPIACSTAAGLAAWR